MGMYMLLILKITVSRSLMLRVIHNKMGSNGSGDGQFYNPSGIAVDISGMYMLLILAIAASRSSMQRVGL